MDGKTVRGARRADGRRPTCWPRCTTHPRVLAQRQVDGGPASRRGSQPLLAGWTWPARWSPPTRCTPTADAADYLVASKGRTTCSSSRPTSPACCHRCQRLPWHRVPVLDPTATAATAASSCAPSGPHRRTGFGFPHAGQILRVGR